MLFISARGSTQFTIISVFTLSYHTSRVRLSVALGIPQADLGMPLCDGWCTGIDLSQVCEACALPLSHISAKLFYLRYLCTSTPKNCCVRRHVGWKRPKEKPIFYLIKVSSISHHMTVWCSRARIWARESMGWYFHHIIKQEHSDISLACQWKMKNWKRGRSYNRGFGLLFLLFLLFWMLGYTCLWPGLTSSHELKVILAVLRELYGIPVMEPD